MASAVVVGEVSHQTVSAKNLAEFVMYLFVTDEPPISFQGSLSIVSHEGERGSGLASHGRLAARAGDGADASASPTRCGLLMPAHTRGVRY